MEAILSAVEHGEEECRELRLQAQALEQRAAQEEARTSRICAHGSNTIDRVALERLRQAVMALDAHPEDIAALAAVAQQAGSLARVVDGYARLRSAALAE
jgi:fructose-1,6-bisphosphatase/inositol monophosphatase family enzyme